MSSVASGWSGSFIIGPAGESELVNRQLSNSLKFNRLPSKRRQRQKCRFKLTVKTFKVFHISMTSRLQLIFTEFWLLNLNWQNQFSCSRITRPYNLPISKTICKFYKWKAKTISKPQQLITISTEVTVEPPLTVTSPQRQRPLKLVPNCRNNLPTTATVFSDWRNGHETSTINRDKSFNSFKMKKQYFLWEHFILRTHTSPWEPVSFYTTTCPYRAPLLNGHFLLFTSKVAVMERFDSTVWTKLIFHYHRPQPLKAL